MAKFKQQLEGILSSGELGELEQFRDAKLWLGMTSDERELLGTLFVMQGENELKTGSQHVLESFKLASKIAPKSPLILYRQAMAYAKREDNMYCLTSACKNFEKLVEIDPKFFDGWYNWGIVLIKLGLHTSDIKHFEEADKVFSKAEAVAVQESPLKWAQMYREWGICWYYLGKISGEAGDFKKAISLYQKATDNGWEGADLWNDYGNALVEMSNLLNNHNILLEAIEYYWKSIHEDSDCLQGWLALSFSFQKLFLSTYIETYFDLSVECFENVVRLDPHNSLPWMRWGQLLSVRAKNKRDEAMMLESLKKHENADMCEPNHPLILSAWAEAQMAYGTLTDNLQYLREAEKKILLSLEMEPENPDIWGLHANCMLELGNYFGDTRYYEKAIEKFTHAITHVRDDPTLWHGLVMANLMLGDATQDKKSLKHAAKLCMEVVDTGGQNNPFFWNDWGVILMKLGSMTQEKRYIEAAIAKFEQAIRLKKTDSHADNIEIEWLYNYGCALDFLGDYHDSAVNYEKACQVLTRVLEINPHFYMAHFNLAMSLSHLGELNDDAESFYQSFHHFAIYTENYREDESGWCEWGLAILNLALLILDPLHPDEAMKLFEESEERLLRGLQLGALNANYHLASLYSLTGNYQSSMDYLEKAYRVGVITDIEDLLHDEWLEGVRLTPAFEKFYHDIVRNENDRSR